MSLDQNDVLLDTLLVNAVPAGNTEGLDKGLTIPKNTSAGSYYILADADANDDLIESNESNNLASISVTVNLYGKDLSYESLVMDDVLQNNTLNFSYDITNYGSSTAGKHVVKYYLSDNSDLVKDGSLITQETIDSVQFNSTLAMVKQFNFANCIDTGYHYLKIVLDDEINVSEVNENNNIAVDSFYVSAGLGDLTFYSSISLDKTTVGTQDVVQISYGIENNSTTPLAASDMKIYLSTDQILNEGDLLIDSVQTSSLTSCQSSFGLLKNITIPEGFSFGSYYVLAQLDSDNAIEEADEDNNLASRQLEISNNPDLSINTFTISQDSIEYGGALPVQINIENLSSTGNVGSSVVSYFLSTDDVLDELDTELGSTTSVSEIAASANTGTINDNLLVNACISIGDYYLIASADGADQVNESDETNNTFFLALKLLAGQPVLSSSRSVINITANSADFNANIYCNGGANISEKGIYWGTSANPEVTGTKIVDSDPGDSFTTPITGLNPGTKYYAKAFATNSEGTDYGDVVEFETKNITVTNITSSTAQINWGHLSISATNFTVLYYEKYSTDYNSQTLSSTSATIPVIPNTTYIVQLRYYSGGSWSSYMQPVEFTTQSGEQVLASDIKITNIQANSADVNWKGKNADSYLIWYYETGTSDNKIVTTTSSPATISVVPSTNYTLKVKSLINGNWTKYTPEIEFSSIAGAQVIANNVSVTNVTSSSAQVNWDGEGADNYVVLYYETGTTDYKVLTTTSSPATISLIPSTNYSVKVRTFIGEQRTNYTEPVEFTSAAGAQVIADNVTVDNITSNSAQVNWDGTGADYYFILYYETGTSNYQLLFTSGSPEVLTLQASTDYTVKVNTVLDGQKTGYTPAVNFTTAPDGGFAPPMAGGEENNDANIYIDSRPNLDQNNVEWNIYPNPASEYVQIDLVSEKLEEVTISIYDVNGRLIKKIQQPAGFNQTMNLNIETIQTGIYFIRLETPSYTETRKIFKR